MAGLDCLENSSEWLRGEAGLSTETAAEGMPGSVGVAHAEVVDAVVVGIEEEACSGLMGCHD
jgi:hypothetical protein